MNLTEKTREFLHQWLNKNFVSSIRKGMVEDLEKFALDISAEIESNKAAQRMKEQAQEAPKSEA
jgi:hypothetical protein